MRTGYWELIVVYENGDDNIWVYESEEAAREAEQSVRLAAGNQIQWTGIRPQLVK